MSISSKLLKILLKRTKKQNSSPDPKQLEYGELMVDYREGEEGLFLRNSADKIVKLSTRDADWNGWDFKYGSLTAPKNYVINYNGYNVLFDDSLTPRKYVDDKIKQSIDDAMLKIDLSKFASKDEIIEALKELVENVSGNDDQIVEIADQIHALQRQVAEIANLSGPANAENYAASVAKLKEDVLKINKKINEIVVPPAPDMSIYVTVSAFNNAKDQIIATHSDDVTKINLELNKLTKQVFDVSNLTNEHEKSLNAIKKAKVQCTWNDVANKPTKFQPTSHSHDLSDISGLGDQINDRISKSTAFNKLRGEIEKQSQLFDGRIAVSGQRGELCGYSKSLIQSANNFTVNKLSNDSIVWKGSGTVTIDFQKGDFGDCAVKLICLQSIGKSNLVVNNCRWVGGTVPKWGEQNSVLIIVANFIGGQVVLNEFDCYTDPEIS